MSKDLNIIGGKDNNIKSKLLVNEEQEQEQDQEKDLITDEDEDESKKLLLPRKGGLSTNPVKKVQWNDTKLTQILEYQPSEASDVDDEDSDACICKIM